MNEKNHISREELIALQCDLINNSEKIKLMEHICSCDYCADQFTALMSEDLITAPMDMKDNILKAARRPDVQLAAKARETSKKMQLFLYSLKVCTATVCALLLLVFTMNFSTITNTFNPSGNVFTENTESTKVGKSLTTAIREGIDTINNSMLDFSNTIMNTEVTDHD